MTVNFTEISVPARLAELPALLATTESEAGRLAGVDIPRLLLVVEELFVNTVLHGHGGDSDRLVRLAIGNDTAGGIALRYEDDAPAFDPNDFEPNLPSTAAAGGLGIALVRGLCRDVRYCREGNCNRLDLLI